METARTIKQFKNQKGIAGVFFQGEFLSRYLCFLLSCYESLVKIAFTLLRHFFT